MARMFLSGGLLTVGSRPNRPVVGMAAPEILWASVHNGGGGNGGADDEAAGYMPGGVVKSPASPGGAGIRGKRLLLRSSRR